MKKLMIIFIVGGLFMGCAVKINPVEYYDEHGNKITSPDVVTENPYAYVYMTTASNCWLRSDPNAIDELKKIPQGTKLGVLEVKTVQQGMLKNDWYKVTYKGKTGWVSEHNFF